MMQSGARREKPDLDLTGDDLTAETKLDMLVEYLQEIASGSAAWPKMDDDELKRLIRASGNLKRWVSCIKSTATHSAAAGPRGALFSEIIGALVAAMEIGMYGNVTASAGIHFKMDRAKASAKKGLPTRNKKVDDRRQYVAQQVEARRSKNSRLPQDELIHKLKQNWDHVGPVPSDSTLKNDIRFLNKVQKQRASSLHSKS